MLRQGRLGLGRCWGQVRRPVSGFPRRDWYRRDPKWRSRRSPATATACFHSGISGWFSLSLNPLARGCRRSWRGEVWKYGFGGGVNRFLRRYTRAREVFLNSQCRRDAARPARAAWAVPRLLAARWRGRRRRRRRFGLSDFRFEAAAATLSATGSASPRPDRNSWLRGATACFLSGISGWFSLSLNPLARGCRRSWRGE